MKKFIAGLIVLLLNTSLFALKEDKIESEMRTKVDVVINTLQSEVSIEEKTKTIFNVMDEVFDYKVMSQISLGREWKNIDENERIAFSKEFEKKLKNSYVEKLDLYTDQKIEFKELKKLNPKRIQLQSFIIGKDENYEVLYKFYKASNDEWYIYDVSIIGVSIMQTYRQQFASYLSKEGNSFKDLLVSMNKPAEK